MALGPSCSWGSETGAAPVTERRVPEGRPEPTSGDSGVEESLDGGDRVALLTGKTGSTF